MARGRRGTEIEIEIKKGIPIPERLSPLEERMQVMEVGDCFSLVKPGTRIQQRVRLAFQKLGFAYERRESFGDTVIWWRVA